MTKEDKIWFCRMNGDSVYPKRKLLVSPEVNGMPPTVKISTLVYVEKNNLTYVIPHITTHVIANYDQLSTMIVHFEIACEKIKNDDVISEEDLTLKDLQ